MNCYKLNPTLAAGVLAIGLGFLAAPAAAQAWPEEPITIVMPNNPGGATDRLARVMAPMLSEELGVPVNVINRPGGGTLIGHAYLHAQPADGYHFSYTSLPYLISNIVNQGAPFGMDDFSWINIQEVANTVVFAHNSTPYETFEQFVEGLRQPGQVSVAVIGGSSEHMSALILMDTLGLPRSNMRLVTYDGGGTARTAIAGGQVDIAMVPGQGSEQLVDFTRMLAIYADEPVEGFDAPLVNEILASENVSVPIIPSSVRIFIGRKEFEASNPEGYARFVDAYERVVTSEAFQEVARAQNLGRDWRGPEASSVLADEVYDQIIRYSTVISD